MTLKWSIDQAKGRLTFGKLIPMTGNTYEIQVSGQTAGTAYMFYVMDGSGEKCLARSEQDEDSGVYTIAFNQTELRRQFEKEWHEIRCFHTVVSDGENTIAEGDLAICWNPVWTDPGTGKAYSMRGPEGRQGPPGPEGPEGRQGPAVPLDNQVSESSANGVKSYAIWTFVKGLLPSWLTSTREEPPTQAIVSAKYTKPGSGIPKSDLSTSVQNSLGRADSALQTHQDISGKADKATTYTKSETNAKIVANVENSVTSTSTTKALSAKAGKDLNESIQTLDQQVVKHNSFADLNTKENMTLKEAGDMINTLILKLKSSVVTSVALCTLEVFAGGTSIGPDTEFGDISPTNKLKTVVEASGALGKAALTSVTNSDGVAMQDLNGTTIEIPDLIGIEWKTGGNVSTNRVYGIAYGNRRLVAGCADRISYSDDNGMTWNTATNEYCSCITYGNGRFVACSGNEILYSDDGHTWIKSEVRGTEGLYHTEFSKTIYGDGRFVAVETFNGYLYYSDNGETWDKGGNFSSQLYGGIAYGNGRYLFGRYGSGLWYSDDGIAVNWIGNIEADMMAYGNGRFVSCGSAIYNNGEIKIRYSDDGINWTKGSIQLPAAVKSIWANDIAYGNGRFVVAGSTVLDDESLTDESYYSDDGINWIKGGKFGVDTRGAVGAICYGDERFWAGRFYGESYISDGIYNRIPVVQQVLVNGDPIPQDASNRIDIAEAIREIASSAIDNTVTTAFIRERLGVYLYVGEDGGIYVHTGEE